MKRYTQFNRLIVDDFTTDVWTHPLHNHNHYEVIFIRSGSGIHHLNNSLVPYRAGHLYLLGPEDEHEFIIEEPTNFVYFKFTKLYFDTFDGENPAVWNQHIDKLLSKKWSRKRNLLKNKEDINIVDDLFKLIVEEYERNALLGKKLVNHHFKAILLVLNRNGPNCDKKQQRRADSDITEALLEYIELNIYDPKSVSQKEIARYFHYSPNYIGILFKKNIGTSLKKYIQDYRFNLLKQRLKHGHQSTKQLSLDFGFTDESHLHKFVKTQSGKSFISLKEELVPEMIL